MRLYDELELLPPAAVNPHLGYRYHERAQLHRARLIAALRRAGMPLAEIPAVCGLAPEMAAETVDAWWRRVSADTAARGRVVALLVDRLSERDATMSDPTFRYAARCTAGAVRDSNEDTAYARDRLLAVAGGLRGLGAAAASTAAVDALRPLELADAPALLSRALGGGVPVEADLALRTALVGDRYLLCSDGLSAVVGPEALRAALAGADDPETAVGHLVDLAYAEGAPDNVACVVAG